MGIEAFVRVFAMPEDSGAHGSRTRRIPADAAAIEQFLGRLLGCNVCATLTVPDDFFEGDAIVATYVDLKTPEALCICEIETAAILAASASIVDANALEAAIRAKRIDGLLRERLYSLSELMESLFVVAPIDSDANRLWLRDVNYLTEVSDEVRKLINKHDARTMVNLSVSGKPAGRLVLLAR
jgi:hypothetical protein